MVSLTKKIDYEFENANFDIQTIFNRCTMITCQLENGFVILEYDISDSTENFSYISSKSRCMDKIRNKIRMLEEYKMSCELNKK